MPTSLLLIDTMIPRMVTEMREAMAKPEPLTVEEMARLRELIENKDKESDEEQEERMQLQVKQDRFFEEVRLPIDEPPSKEQVLEKIKSRKQAQKKVRGVLRYSWIGALILLVASLVHSEHAPYLLWLAGMTLRLQITEGLLFDGGFTRQRLLSILSVEMAYPLYRWMAAPQLPFSHSLVYGTLAFAIVLWLVVLFITLDAYRPTPPPKTKKKAKEKSKPPGNKKRKRS